METSKVVDNKEHTKSMRIIRNVYLYLMAMIGMITLIFGLVTAVNNVFSNYVFQVNDSYYAYPVGSGPCDQLSPVSPDPTQKKVELTTQQIADCEANVQKNNDMNRKNNIGREFSISIAQILVGLPIWFFHWGIIQKESKRKEENA